MTVQTFALWVTTTRGTWWRSCSPSWPEISKRLRSEITWLPVRCECWKLLHYYTSLSRSKKALRRVLWISRVCLMETEGGLASNGAPPPSPASPVCCCEQTGVNKPGKKSCLLIYSQELSQLTWLSILVFFHRDVLQLFKCKNRVPPWVFRKTGEHPKTNQCQLMDGYMNKRLCVCVFPSCSEGLLEDFLLVCQNESLPQRAVELVQFSATFCLSATKKLATCALADFDLTDEQRWGRGYQHIHTFS